MAKLMKFKSEWGSGTAYYLSPSLGTAPVGESFWNLNLFSYEMDMEENWEKQSYAPLLVSTLRHIYLSFRGKT